MADYTYEQLKDLTVAQLREIAQGSQHEAVQGFSTMHKDHLLPALCKALGIEAHARHVAHGAAKTKLKQQIRKLKKDRDTLLKAKDYPKLKGVHHELHRLKHTLRRMAEKGPK